MVLDLIEGERLNARFVGLPLEARAAGVNSGRNRAREVNSRQLKVEGKDS